VYFVYLLLVGGYLVYGTFTQTGLGGWVLAQELEWFGSASQKLTVLLPLVVAMVLPLLLLAPFLPRGERAQLAGPLLPPQPARPVSWKQLLVLGLVPPLVALPAYYYVQRQAERDENRPVASLDLVARPDAPLPADTKFA
jgi:sorbitol-specific phosphotransferase system component IIBC